MTETVPYQTHQCNGTDPSGLNRCENQVAARRPSKTGVHWCPAPRCQAAKQRYYSARRRQEFAEPDSPPRVVGELTDAVLEEFRVVIAGLDRGREQCTVCGYERGVVGLAHPHRLRPAEACFALGSGGRTLFPLGIFAMICPEQELTYDEKVAAAAERGVVLPHA